MKQKLSEGVKGYDARVGSGLSRGPNLRKKALAAPWSETWPAPGATLDLDFANNRGYVRGVGQGDAMQAVTFTRASNGTFVGSDGLLKTYANQGALGNNLLTFPQDFDNAAWSKSNTAVQANADNAPNGTLTADRVNASSSNGTITQSYTAAAGNHTFSVYIKRVSGTGNIDITCHSSGTWVTQTITEEWARYTVTQSLSAGANTPGIRIATSGDVILIWGAQLELGSSATEYFPTNINQPRFDWASTAQVANVNLLQYTQEFDNAYWEKIDGTISANATTSPDGTTTADKMVASSAGGNASIGVRNTAFTLPSAGTYTYSVYVKADTLSWVALFTGGFDSSANGTSYFDVGNGTLGTKSANHSASTITDAGNGWWRCSITITTISDLQGDFAIILADADLDISVARNGTNALFLWGAQLELGSSVTTYQPIAQPTTNTPLAANSTCNGLLIEESRANRILWCRDATQSNWTKTNVTATKDQTGIDGVANAATRLTATSANGTCIQTITLASGSRTGSVFLKRITGTGNIQVSLDGSTWSTVDLSSTEWRRIVLSGTVTNPVVGIRLATNGDEVAMDYAQVEDGAFATSPILTTTASVTRSADVASITAPTAITNEQFTLFARMQSFDTGDFGVIRMSGSGFVNSLIKYSGFLQTSNNAQPSFSVSTTDATVKRSMALSFRKNNYLYTDSGKTTAERNYATISQNTAGMTIGYDANFGYLNGWIERVVFNPKFINATSLQELTR